MSKLRIAYFGAPDFAATVLEKVVTELNSVSVELVVTQPDKPVGRKKIMTPTPVKMMAQKYNIPVFDQALQNSKFKIQSSKFDICLLYAYGEFIPQEILSLPKYGFWNIHPSLLPLYRGASPVAYPLLLGDTETGVTLMQMDSELDHGPIIAQEHISINQIDDRTKLTEKLTIVGVELFKKQIYDLGFKMYESREQDHSKATYTRQLTKQDGFIELSHLKKSLKNEVIEKHEIPQIIKEYFERNKILNSIFQIQNSSVLVWNLYRGLSDWPGIWTTVDIDGQTKRLKIISLNKTETGIQIEKVQLEGKNEVDFETFNRAYKLF